MKDIQANLVGCLNLGRQGENIRTRVVFDISDLIDEYPNGAPSLVHRCPNETEDHPIVITYADKKCYWVVSEDELANEGYGECQLTVSFGNGRSRSKIWKTSVGRSLVSNGTPPDHWTDWKQDIQTISAQATLQASNAANSASQAQASALAAANSASASASERQTAALEAIKARSEKLEAAGYSDTAHQYSVAAGNHENTAKQYKDQTQVLYNLAVENKEASNDILEELQDVETTVQTEVAKAKQYSDNAESMAGSATGSAAAANQYSQNARTSELNAAQSETKAAASEQKAKNYELSTSGYLSDTMSAMYFAMDAETAAVAAKNGAVAAQADAYSSRLDALNARNAAQSAYSMTESIKTEVITAKNSVDNTLTEIQTKLANGEFKGEPGSDAEVTSSNIQNALGYIPANTNHTHSYNDLTNKPTIPSAYDDTEVRGLIESLDSGKADADHVHSYNDLLDKPTIPSAYDDTSVKSRLTTVEGTATQLSGQIAQLPTGVQVNGVDLVKDSNGKVNVPVASNTEFGVVKSNASNGVWVNRGYVTANKASTDEVISRTSSPLLTPQNTNQIVKSALTDAKRITGLTDTEKDNACEVIGAERAKGEWELILSNTFVFDTASDIVINLGEAKNHVRVFMFCTNDGVSKVENYGLGKIYLNGVDKGNMFELGSFSVANEAKSSYIKYDADDMPLFTTWAGSGGRSPLAVRNGKVAEIARSINFNPTPIDKIVLEKYTGTFYVKVYAK